MIRTIGDSMAAEAAQVLATLAEGHCPIHRTHLEDPHPAWGGWCPTCDIRWSSNDRAVHVTALTSTGSYGHAWSVEQVRQMLAPRAILADTITEVGASARRTP